MEMSTSAEPERPAAKGRATKAVETTSSHRKRRQRPALEKTLETLKALETAGELITNAILAIRAGTSTGTASHARIIRDVVAEEVSEQLATTALLASEANEDRAIDASLTLKQKVKLDDAIRIHVARLERMFEARVSTEVRRRIDTADDYVRKDNAEKEKLIAGLEDLLRGKGVFTAAEYGDLVKCIHPDNSASSEVRARVFNAVHKNKERLLKRD